MDAGAHSPPILELTELATGEHKQALTRDFREKFALPASGIGVAVRYDEAYELVGSLMQDPTSWLQASLAGWSHPTSYEAMILMDLHDLEHSGRVKRAQFKPYPRPFDRKNRIGGKRSIQRTPDEVHAILRTAGLSHPLT